jgi:hypothetical protein
MILNIIEEGRYIRILYKVYRSEKYYNKIAIKFLIFYFKKVGRIKFVFCERFFKIINTPSSWIYC